jgi:2-hydroxychromene-2-carboxylate isomerase
LERITGALGLPFKRPAVFPQNGLLAARVALALEPSGLTPAFSRAVFVANFAEGRDISDRGAIAELIGEIGANADETLALAGAPETKERLRSQTESALTLGLFGAPSIRAGEELFWGNDRLEAALDWAARRAERVAST